MKDVIRFSASYAALAAVTVGGLLVLTGCSSDPEKASGLRDDVKYLPSEKAVAAKTHTTSEVVKKTKKVCVGTGYKKTCMDRADGTKTVTTTVTDKPGKPAKSEMWCVELDDVNGKPDSDDQWYEVSSSTYGKWKNEAEGTKVTDMEYFRSVSSCKH